MSDRKVGVVATEREWAVALNVMMYAAMQAANNIHSDDEAVAATARALTPSLKQLTTLIDKMQSAAPRIVAG